MSAITRGVVAAVLLACAVAGAAAFPRFLAEPGGDQTTQVAPLPAGTEPAIVYAPTLPEPVLVPAAVARAFGARIAPLPGNLRPVVIHRVAPPPRVAPEPAPAPPPAPAPAPAVVQVSAPAVIPVAAAPAPATPAAATPAPVQRSPSHDNGNGKDHAKKQGRVVAAFQPLPSTNDGPPAQIPSGTGSGDGGAVRPVETPDAQTAPADHGHGAPPWANGGGKGN